MTVDQSLLIRVRKLLKDNRIFSERAALGGICFFHYGRVLCAVNKNRLILRVGNDQYEAALLLQHTRPLEISGEPVAGYILVLPQALKTEERLKKWLNLGLNFTNRLPLKKSAI